MNDLSTNNNLKSVNNPDQKQTSNEKIIALQKENEELNGEIEMLYGQVNNLKCIANIISSSLKRPHDLAARFGGEEFVCLLPETDLNGAAVVANSILDAMRKYKIPHTNSKVANFVTVSIGGTSKIPEVQDGFTELIIKADNFLYESKLSGRDRMTIK